jgi:hypothetical protein
VVAQAVGGGLEEVGEESAAFAEDAAQDFGDGEDELAVGDGVADVGADPFGGLAGAALVAGGADVAGFAGEGEEALMAAVGAVVAGEAGGQVATTVVGLDGGDGFRAEGTHGGAVVFLITSEEVVPGGVDDLPKWGGTGAAGLVDGCHNCSLEQLWYARSFTGEKSPSGPADAGCLLEEGHLPCVGIADGFLPRLRGHAGRHGDFFDALGGLVAGFELLEDFFGSRGDVFGEAGEAGDLDAVEEMAGTDTLLTRCLIKGH